MTVAVVTDSTADLPSDLAEVLGLRVVPMSVQFGERTYISRITITDAEFYDRLATTDELPSTSQPAPAWFEEAYADAADDGADAIVSLHVSAELSGTVELAERLGSEASLDVHVVDSRQVGGGLALQVLAAHDVARRGGSVDEVIAAAEAVRDTVRTYVVVDTLEHLRKGGRLTGAQALVGSMLRVKPVLHLTEGRVEVLERARTWNRALDRLADLAAVALGDEPGHVAVTHSVAPERAAELWDRLTARIDVRERLEAVIGPVVGTHTGPGAVSVSVVPARLTGGASADER